MTTAAADAMPPALPQHLSLELTLIVAATARDMGIGAHGGLPWTGLRKEMAYFARVTKGAATAAGAATTDSQPNAVVMGRRTWESIPPRFRPLRGRLNVVVSRSFAPGVPQDPAGGPDAAPVQASSLETALDYLRRRRWQTNNATTTPPRVFVIGGAQMYAAALGLAEARRVLLTRVHADFACDTFFPLALGAAAAAPATTSSTSWVQRSRDEHAAWVGEAVPEGRQTENGVTYEFEMWEKVDETEE